MELLEEVITAAQRDIYQIHHRKSVRSWKPICFMSRIKNILLSFPHFLLTGFLEIQLQESFEGAHKRKWILLHRYAAASSKVLQGREQQTGPFKWIAACTVCCLADLLCLGLQLILAALEGGVHYQLVMATHGKVRPRTHNCAILTYKPC